MSIRLAFGHERDLDIETLLRRIQGYYPDADIDFIRKAYEFAEKSHRGQMRSSGEPYIIHPLNVANILTSMRMDIHTIIGGLLHDTIEDCDVTEEDIRKEFTPEIAER